MTKLISSKEVVARKDHDCQASDWLCNSGWNGMGFSRDELRSISKARNNGFKIKKGDKYIKQCLTNDGEIYTFKAIPAIHDICIDYDLYPL